MSKRDGVYVHCVGSVDEAMKENGSYDTIQMLNKFEEGKVYFVDLVVENERHMRIIISGEMVYLVPADDYSIDAE